jgi:hypothetical protein
VVPISKRRTNQPQKKSLMARFYGSKKGFANFPLQTLDFVGGGDGD